MTNKKSVAFPLLDTIETTQKSKTSTKPININALQAQNLKKKYDTSSRKINNNNSSAIKSFEHYKKLSDDIAGSLIYYDSILQDRAEKIYNCGTYVELSDGVVISSNFCRQRLCPMCQRRRSLNVAAKTKRIQEYLQDKKYKYLHLVLTVPNVSGDELSDTIDNLYSYSSAFFKLDCIKNKFKGVMRCLEVSVNPRRVVNSREVYNLSGDYMHPHLHCLIAVSKSYGSGKNYIKQNELLECWRKVTGDNRINSLCIKAVKDDGAISEIAKYCVKPLDFNVDSETRCTILEEIYSALHGRRLIQLYGCFRLASKALKIDINNDDEIDNIDLINIKRYTYNRREGIYDEVTSI